MVHRHIAEEEGRVVLTNEMSVPRLHLHLHPHDWDCDRVILDNIDPFLRMRRW
jgi:hypothetical protein